MDRELRMQLLRAAARDRSFLKAAGRDLRPTDFPEVEEQVIATAALSFYDTYEEPVGALLRDRVDDTITRWNRKLSGDTRSKTKDVLKTIYGSKMEMVSVKALEDRVHQLRKTSFFDQATEDFITLQEKGELTSAFFEDLVEKAQRELGGSGVTATDYLTEADLLRRVERRA